MLKYGEILETEPRRCDAFLSVAGVGDAPRKGKGLSARFGRLAGVKPEVHGETFQRAEKGSSFHTFLLSMANLALSVNFLYSICI